MADTIVGIQVVGDTSGLTRELKTAGEAVQQFSGTVSYMVPVLKQTTQAEEETTVATKQVSQAVNESVGFFTKLLSIAPAVGAGFSKIGHDALEAGAEVQESSATMVEGLVKVAEAARLANGQFSFFAAGSALLGGPAVLGIITELSDRLAENAIHFEHLSGVTGTETAKLAALSQTMKAAGVENDNVGQAALRFSRAVDAAANGGARQQKALSELNITSKDFVAALGEAAVHLQQSNNYTQDAANLSILFGRNVQNLIGFLRASGSEFGNLIAQHLQYGESLEKAIPAAQKLIQQQVQLREQFDILALSTFPAITKGLQAIQFEFLYLKEAFITGSIYLGAFIDVGKLGLGGVTSVVLNLNSALLATGAALIGDFSAVKRFTDQAGEYLQQARSQFAQIPGVISEANKKATAALVEGRKEYQDLVSKNTQKPAGFSAKPGDEGIEFGASSQAKEAAANAEVENWQKHQQAILAISKAAFAEQVRIGDVSYADQASRAIAFAAQELQIEETATARKIAIQKSSENAANDPAALVKLLGDQQVARDKFNKEVVESANTRVTEETKLEKETEDLIAKELEATLKALHAAAKAYDEEYFKQQEALAKYQEYVDKKAAIDREAVIKRQQTEAETAVSTLKSGRGVKDIELSETGIGGNWQARIASVRAYETEIEAAIAKVNQLALREAQAKDDEANRERQKAHDTAVGSGAQNVPDFKPQDTNAQDAATAATKRLSAAQDEYNQKIAEMQKEWQKALGAGFFAKINSEFSTTIAALINGTESVSKAFQKMGAKLVTDLAVGFAQMLLKFAETQLKMVLIHQAATAQQTATTAAGAAAGQAISTTMAIKQVFIAAKTAAANTYAAVSAIPVVGPFIAPPAAAAAFAGVLALGAFEQGGVVGNQAGVALLHPKEMVLPRRLSEGVQNMVNSSNSNNSSTQGGDTHVHYHAASGETPQSISANKQAVLKIVREANRNGQLSPSGAYAR